MSRLSRVAILNNLLIKKKKKRVRFITFDKIMSACLFQLRKIQVPCGFKSIIVFSCTAPDVIPKNLKGVGTWRNNMEISWEVTRTVIKP